MAISFKDSLVVGISSRALFDLEEENAFFHAHGIEEYRKRQLELRNTVLRKGTAFHLIEALLSLNTKVHDKRLVEVIVMSRNSPETGLRVLNSVSEYGLDITRSAFTGGEPLPAYVEAFEVDLFLSRDSEDVQAVREQGKCAAALVLDAPEDFIPDHNCVRMAFDADAVLVDEESEIVYKTKGIDAFYEHERLRENQPLQDGPFANLLRKLSITQSSLSPNSRYLRIAIVTARNSPAHKRLINTLIHWNVNVDEAFFLGGLPKDNILKAFKAHMFFDDQRIHLDATSRVVPSGHVPYKSGSVLNGSPA